MVRPVACALLALGLSPVALLAAESQPNWPTFRGSDRLAFSPVTGLLKSWPEGGPKLLWEAAGAGRGYSSLAIADGRIYTLGDALSTAGDKDEYLTCFEEATGKQLWMTKTGEPWSSGNPSWQSSRSTPTVDGERVYVLTPYGVLVCCESASGKELWRKDLVKEFGGKKGDQWKYSESVLVDGDKVICTPGGATKTMVALHKESGDTIWTVDRPGNRGAGHSSPAVSTIGDTRVYVQVTSSGPMGVRASDGKLLWTYDIGQVTAVIPTPIVRDDLVFFTAGYRYGGALLRQVPNEGEIKIEEVYPINPELAVKHGGVVLVGDLLFGDSDDKGQPWCADLMTGKVHWKLEARRGTPEARRGSGSVAAADGCVYFRFADGTMELVEATAAERKVLGQFKIPGSGERPSWSHPVVTGGKLYLREGDKVLCYDLRG
jgi:outer membrane protein assembly factor BamB